eukprot:UN16143
MNHTFEETIMNVMNVVAFVAMAVVAVRIAKQNHEADVQEHMVFAQMKKLSQNKLGP